MKTTSFSLCLLVSAFFLAFPHQAIAQDNDEEALDISADHLELSNDILLLKDNVVVVSDSLRLVAHSGKYDRETGVIVLVGSPVTGYGCNTDGCDPRVEHTFSFTSDSLELNEDSEKLFATGNVTLVDGKLTLKARTMHFDTRNGELKLSSSTE